MKRVTLLVSLFLMSFTSFGQGNLKCIEGAKRTAFVYDIEKTHENSEQLEITLLTKFGNCESGEFISEPVYRDDLKAKIHKDGWNIPFTKPIATIEAIEFGSDNEYQLRVKIQKNKAYKKRDHRVFGIEFRIDNSKRKFIWELHTSKKSDGSINIKIPNKRVFQSFNAY